MRLPLRDRKLLMMRRMAEINDVIDGDWLSDQIGDYMLHAECPPMQRRLLNENTISALSACGIIMPIEYIQPCFNYIKQRYNDTCDDDYGIRDWAIHNGVQIITTIPALVQHLGDDSIANKGSPIRRTVYYKQNPKANWASQKVMQYQIPEWFFSNHGKMRTDGGTLRVVAE